MNNQPPQTMAPNAVSIGGFFTDPAMDIGQVFATIARVKDGDADSGYAAWRATAEKLHGHARASLEAGHTETAHRQFLAASEGYAQAVAFTDGQTDQTTLASTFALQNECGEAFVDASVGEVDADFGVIRLGENLRSSG